MFRISQFMQEIADPSPPRPRRAPPGPVVIWNLVRRCNLTCKHCYSISADKDFPGELSMAEVDTVMDDLGAFGVPVLILSFADATRIGRQCRSYHGAFGGPRRSAGLT